MACWVKAVVQLARASGISADTADNDFYFLCSDIDEISSGRADALRDNLVSFYNDVHAPGTADIASWLSIVLSRTASACSISFYSVEEFPTFPIVWGSPKQVRNWTLDAGGGGYGPLPSEVALVMTYHSLLTDVPETESNPTPPPAFIRPAARRRGRIYLGPLAQQAISYTGPTNEPFPIVGLTNAISGAAANLLTATPANTDWTQLSQAEGSMFSVTGGWIDNAFDSQRRRGNDPTTRTTWGGP